MNAALLLTVALICFSIAYFFYGRFLSRIFGVDKSRLTPAHELTDGVDYVPAKNAWVLFGHHFSSICGAGPIVGPVLACVYWGWGVSFVWIVVGAVWMGAVSDFTSLMMSVRAKGVSIAQIAGFEISDKVRFFFSVFLWVSLILVISVFSIFAAKTFISEPDTVVPSLGLIPTAVLIGWLLYRTKFSNTLSTVIGLGILGGLLFAGTWFPIELRAVGSVSSEFIWVVILLVYCFFASVLPVNLLLQPRDYLASFVLFGMIALGLLGVFVARPEMNIPFYSGFLPNEWPESGPLWPMLFVTIACGAISGFHALVSSGTTCKQISSETHCRPIGYGGMLLEATVGVLVLTVVCAGLNRETAAALIRSGGPIATFSHGYGALTKTFLGDYASSFAVLALNAFILTTLDTATRITRYLTSELFGIKNMYLSTLLVVSASALLAWTGKWNLLWPAFGASNQLIAGITLMIASCWLLNRGKSFWVTLVPTIIMLTTTVAAFGFQALQAAQKKNELGEPSPDWLMLFVIAALISLAVSILRQTVNVFKRRRTAGTV